MTPKVELVPNEQIDYPPLDAKAYRCPFCHVPVPSTQRREDWPTVLCLGADGHVLEWA